MNFTLHKNVVFWWFLDPWTQIFKHVMLYYLTGKKDAKNCAKVPKVCELLDQIPPAKTCVRGQVRSELLHKKKKQSIANYN